MELLDRERPRFTPGCVEDGLGCTDPPPSSSLETSQKRSGDSHGAARGPSYVNNGSKCIVVDGADEPADGASLRKRKVQEASMEDARVAFEDGLRMVMDGLEKVGEARTRLENIGETRMLGYNYHTKHTRMCSKLEKYLVPFRGDDMKM
eukprot:9503985-Pyramimonas_sp.AAC.1